MVDASVGLCNKSTAVLLPQGSRSVRAEALGHSMVDVIPITAARCVRLPVMLSVVRRVRAETRWEACAPRNIAVPHYLQRTGRYCMRPWLGQYCSTLHCRRACGERASAHPGSISLRKMITNWATSKAASQNASWRHVVQKQLHECSAPHLVPLYPEQ